MIESKFHNRCEYRQLVKAKTQAGNVLNGAESLIY